VIFLQRLLEFWDWEKAGMGFLSSCTQTEKAVERVLKDSRPPRRPRFLSLSIWECLLPIADCRFGFPAQENWSLV
jgi:hypothetical protein